MANKPMKTMRDARGNDVPVQYVSMYDKQKDKTVLKIRKAFLEAREVLEKVVKFAIGELNVLAGAKESLGAKGNFAARSFDGLVEAGIRQSYSISLDERVIRARELMMGYVAKELGSLGDKAYVVKKLVEAAFKVDSKGFLSRSKITELLSLRVNDAGWNEGAAILREAMTAQKGKRYLYVGVRARVEDDFKPIRLDIADCWPSEA
ncbi:MAG: DUF3164 family protein [Kiritimatiellae bacterium]|nr:DUF3164 family protein [Kiritimatiellia bacterium]